MFFKRKKFEKVKRADVVDAILQLEKQQKEVLDSVDDNKHEIDELMTKGKKESDRDIRLFYAKRIDSLRKANAMAGKRLQFLATNIGAMHNLKNAMEDNEFFENNSNIPLNQMLTNPAELQKFLAKATQKKMLREQSLGETVNLFDDMDATYVEDETVYGVSDGTEDILNMFEAGVASEDDKIFADGKSLRQTEKSEEGIKADE